MMSSDHPELSPLPAERQRARLLHGADSQPSLSLFPPTAPAASWTYNSLDNPHAAFFLSLPPTTTDLNHGRCWLACTTSSSQGKCLSSQSSHCTTASPSLTQELEQVPVRGPDGHYRPREQPVQPMQEDFIGGFHTGPPPAPPPKDHHRLHLPRIASIFGGEDDEPRDEQNTWLPTYPETPKQTTVSPMDLAHMSAVERSQTLKVARMNPHLQFMCGPLLRFDTIDANRVWRGFALVVSACSTPARPMPL